MKRKTEADIKKHKLHNPIPRKKRKPNEHKNKPKAKVRRRLLKNLEVLSRLKEEA